MRALAAVIPGEPAKKSHKRLSKQDKEAILMILHDMSITLLFRLHSLFQCGEDYRC
jgi:hypothetical protein